MAKVRVNMGDAVSGLTLAVVITGARRFRLRLRLGIMALRLAAWLIGCGIDISFEAPDRPATRAPLWVDGWLSQAVLLVCAFLALWHGLGLTASVFTVGCTVIGVIRQIERTRRAAIATGTGALPPV